MTMENQDLERLEATVSKLLEKTRGLSKRVSDGEDEVARLSASKSDAEIRVKLLESALEKVSAEISDIDRRLRVFEMNHDTRKERWNMAINFFVQLVWVAMAALMLSKLGLQAPL
jgi:chromosome segregation ATPase